MTSADDEWPMSQPRIDVCDRGEVVDLEHAVLDSLGVDVDDVARDQVGASAGRIPGVE